MSITKSKTLNSLNLCVFLSTVLSSLGSSHLGGALGFLTLSEFLPYLFVYALFLSFSFSYVKVWISTKRCKKNCGNQPPKCTITRKTVTKESPNNGKRLLIIFFKRITDLSSYQHLGTVISLSFSWTFEYHINRTQPLSLSNKSYFWGPNHVNLFLGSKPKKH